MEKIEKLQAEIQRMKLLKHALDAEPARGVQDPSALAASALSNASTAYGGDSQQSSSTDAVDTPLPPPPPPQNRDTQSAKPLSMQDELRAKLDKMQKRKGNKQDSVCGTEGPELC